MEDEIYDEEFFEGLVFNFYKNYEKLSYYNDYNKKIWKALDAKKIFLDVIDYPDKEDEDYREIYRKEYNSCENLYLMNKDEINQALFEFKEKTDKVGLNKAFESFELSKKQVLFIFKNCFPYSLKYVDLNDLLKYFEEFDISFMKDLEEDFTSIYNIENEGYSKFLYNPILKKVASKAATFDNFFEGQKKNREKFKSLGKERGRIYKLGEKESILDYVVITELEGTSRIFDYLSDKTYLDFPPDTAFNIENIDNIKLAELNSSLNYDAAYGVIFLDEDGNEVSTELTLGELQEINKKIYDKNKKQRKIELYDRNYFNIEKTTSWYKGTDIISPKIDLKLFEFLSLFDFENLGIDYLYIYKGSTTYEINKMGITKDLVMDTFKSDILKSKVKEIVYLYNSTILEIYVE